MPYFKWAPDIEELSSHRGHTEMAMVFTARGSVSLNLHTCIISISQSWLTSERSELTYSEGCTLPFELVDDKWILQFLSWEIEREGTPMSQISSNRCWECSDLRITWADDNSRWDSHYQPAKSLPCNLEEPNSDQKESSLSEIILGKILLKWAFPWYLEIWKP